MIVGIIKNKDKQIGKINVYKKIQNKKKDKNKSVGYIEVFYKNKSIHKEPIYIK